MGNRRNTESRARAYRSAALDEWSELPPVLTPRMVESFTKGALTVKVLENLRISGGGPVFLRRGHPTRGRVLYRRSALVSFLEGLPPAATTTEERIRAEACAAGE